MTVEWEEKVLKCDKDDVQPSGTVGPPTKECL